MRGTLVSIDAWNRRAGARTTVRVGSARNSATLGAGGYVWEPALRRAPRLQMMLADDDLTGTVQVGEGDFAVKVPLVRRSDDARDLDWIGSPVRIYSGDGSDLTRMKTEFVGRVTGGTTNADTGLALLQVAADRAYFDVPLLTLTYGGGGGADGDVELRGNNKPAGFGRPINVPPLLINATLLIYQVDGYGNLQSIAGVYEDLASFGAAAADYPTYAALAAATVTEGTWATCIAQGMFRLGAPPSGTITCDPVCGAGLPGSMMLRWLRTHAGITESRIRAADFDALTAAVQAVVGGSPAVSYWTTESSGILDLMQRVCASCNAVPLLLLDGTIGVSRAIGGGTVLTMQRRGGSPSITAWQSSDPPTPWWRMRMTAARSYYVNSASEIDYEDDIKDMGDYSPTETYRQGMVVRGGDGARYLFTSATPTKGVAPPTAGYWEVYEDAPDATTIRYPSGYTIADKEPAEKNANVTETHQSTSIAGQGQLATQDAAVWASQVTGTGKPDTYATSGDNVLPAFWLDGQFHGWQAAGEPSYSVIEQANIDWGAAYGWHMVVNPGKTAFMFSPLVSVRGGRRINLSGRVFSDRFAKVSAQMMLYDAQGAILQYVTVANFSTFGWSNNGWHDFDAWATLPTNVGIVRFYYQIETTADTSTTLYAGPARMSFSQAGADPTALNTAAAFVGQTAAATAPPAQVFNSYLSISADGLFSGGGGGQVTFGGLGGGDLGRQANVYFGSPYLLEQAGGAGATLGAFKTILGNAAGFLGQTPWATLTYTTARVSRLGDDGYIGAPVIYGTTGSGGYLSARWPAEFGSNVTETRNAAGFAGQTPFATLAAGTSLDNTIFGMPSRLGSYGGYLSADQMQYQSGGIVIAVGQLRPQEAGSNITENRSAASFLGQGPWATTSIAITTVTKPNSNILFNGSLRLGAQGWSNLPSGVTWEAAPDGTRFSSYQNGDSYVYADTAGVIYGGLPLTLSFEQYYTGGVTGNIVVGLQWVDASGTVTGGVYSTGNVWERKAVSGVAPNGTVRARIIWGTGTVPAGQFSGVRKFKLEYGNIATPFTDEATDGARYRNGLTVDDRMPAELGANITENRQAAGFAGQSAWATYGGMNPTVVYGQVRYLQGDGFMEASYVYDGAGQYGNLRNVFPAERGSNITETRQSSSFAGQAAWATYTGLVPGTVAGQVQRLQTDGNLQAAYVYRPGYGTIATYWPQEGGANITENRQASSFAGQSSWATYTGLVPSTVYGQIRYLQGDGFMEASYVYDGSGQYGNLRNVFPAQRGANVTGLNQAASFAGQGYLATQSYVDWASRVTGGDKPESYATGGDNSLPAYWLDGQPHGWVTGGDVASSAIEGANFDWGGNYGWHLSIAAGKTGFLFSPRMQARGGRRVNVSGRIWSSAFNRTGALLIVYDGSGNTLAYLDVQQFSTTGWANSSWHDFDKWLTLPQNAAQVLFYLQMDGSDGTAFQVYAGPMRLSFSQAGADPTGINQAASFAGQSGWATFSRTTAVVNYLQDNGRISDGRALNVSNVFGLRSLSDPPSIYDSLSGSTLSINIDAFSQYGDWGATIGYPSVQIASVSYSTTYLLWRNVSGPEDAGSSYGYSTNIGDALGTNKRYLGRITTRAQGGGGSTGGGYGDPNCVALPMWLLTTRGPVRGYELTRSDVMVILLEDGSLGEHPVEDLRVAQALSCELVMADGYSLTLALNTDVPIGGGRYELAANAWGRSVPTLGAGGERADREVLDVRGIGTVDVLAMRCGDNVFFAGAEPDKLVASHNLPVNTYKP